MIGAVEISLQVYLLLVLCSFIAGIVDSIAGGGGLLTVPALLAAGLPPATALATNKLQSSFGSFSASYFYVSRKIIELKQIKKVIFFTFLGSALGTFLIQRIDSSELGRVIPFMLLGFVVYFSFSPRLGDVDKHHRISFALFSVVMGLIIGFYDGFFGPGTGSFWALAFVSLVGFNLSKATAHSKVLNFVSNISSLIVFLFGGKILWTVGFSMGIGQFVGAQVGSHLVLKNGARLIKPLLIFVSLVMSIKLLVAQYL
jgi:uncharacterized membrane protein YfcA